MRLQRTSGFTVVEMMIVVAIIADLVIIAIPNYQRARQSAQNARVISDLRVSVSAYEMYAAENARYPAEAAAGQLPNGMEQYLRGVSWSSVNAIGGRWDWDYNQGYCLAAVAIDLPRDADPLQMQDIDKRIDNGILSTGIFRERSARRFAYIIE